MKRSYCFVIALQILCWVCAESRSFPPNAGVGVHQAGQNPQDSSRFTLQEGMMNSHGGAKKEESREEYRGMSKIGSRPPSCDNKCYGCSPCEAIQVPTNKNHNTTHFGVQYANYEPEGWKCKCGPTF